MKRLTLLILVYGGLLVSSNVFAQGLTVNGFAEGAFGNRISDNTLFPDKDYTLNETRLQLQLKHTSDNGSFFGAVDFLADNASGDETQTTIREAYTQFSLGSTIDAKVGRQVLTWGTEDLLFMNDVFPEDFIFFFVGREDQYLKHLRVVQSS